MSKQMELRHLAREVKTGLELAIAALAPSDLVDRLAVAAGLLDAITDMALNEAATLPLVTRTVERANKALAAWHQWRDDHPPKALGTPRKTLLKDAEEAADLVLLPRGTSHGPRGGARKVRRVRG